MIKWKSILNELLLKLNFYFIAWIHCSICSHCALPDHSCGGPKDGCFICGELDHKRSTCPKIATSKKVNKWVEFFYCLEKNLPCVICVKQSSTKVCNRGFRSAELFAVFTVIYCSHRWGEGGCKDEWKSLTFYRWDMKITKV